MNKTRCLTRTDTLADVLKAFDAMGTSGLALVNEVGVFEGSVTRADVAKLNEAGAQPEDDLTKFECTPGIAARDDASFADIENLFSASSADQIPMLDADGKLVDFLERRDYQRILLSTPHMGETELNYVVSAFDTNWIAPAGPNLDAFERDLEALTGVENAVALSSGTAAIHLALIALGVTNNDTVLCSTLTFAASVNPVRYLGAEPVFVDSEPDSWNMSPAALRTAIRQCNDTGRKPKVAIVVNLYGQSADMAPILDICAEYGIVVLEDAAESLGATYQGRPSGTFGKIGVFSFNGNKIITTSGGGAIVTEDKALAQQARALAAQARMPVQHYEHEQIGYNYRLSNVLAGIGRGQLEVLSDRVERRREIFDLYRKNLEGFPGLSFMPEPDGFFSTRWLTVMLVASEGSRSSQGLIDHLAENGVEARPVWKPMHAQPVFRDFMYVQHDTARSVSDELFRDGICLPSGSNNTDRDILRVIRHISDYCTTS